MAAVAALMENDQPLCDDVKAFIIEAVTEAKNEIEKSSD